MSYERLFLPAKYPVQNPLQTILLRRSVCSRLTGIGFLSRDRVENSRQDPLLLELQERFCIRRELRLVVGVTPIGDGDPLRLGRRDAVPHFAVRSRPWFQSSAALNTAQRLSQERNAR